MAAGEGAFRQQAARAAAPAARHRSGPAGRRAPRPGDAARGWARRPVRRRGAPFPGAADRGRRRQWADDPLAAGVVEEDELGFSRARAFPLEALRGKPVMRKRTSVGTLSDIVFRTDGTLVGIELEGGERIPYDAALGFAPAS